MYMMFKTDEMKRFTSDFRSRPGPCSSRMPYTLCRHTLD